MNRSDWQALADVRIDEATALLTLAPPRPDGAYYLAGYAVECALKAAIAKQYNQHDWPEKVFVSNCHTHDLAALLRHARLATALAAESKANQAFAWSWHLVEDWTEQSRYERHPLAAAVDLVRAVSDPKNGVLPWIKARW